MAQVSDISEYCIFKADAGHAKELHLLTAEFREQLLENRPLQNLLLNSGEFMEEGQRPKSYLDIVDMTWNRNKIILHLSFLEHAISLATEPHLVVVSSGGLDTSGKTALVYPNEPEERRIALKTAGFAAAKVEQLQCDWFENPKVVETIREYQKTLASAFDEYNLKFVLAKMQYSLLPIIFEDCEEKRLQGRIKEVMDKNSLSALDSAYYGMGNRFFQSMGPGWKKLSKSEFGRLFILNQDDVQKGLAQMVRRLAAR